ncbi:hypothetical protein; putative Type III restriction enzyme [Bradyrhizobium sp. ORS 278]|uniref:DEAD/DEAH box helicase n=1 Tax=Bradyrhizobium sp. (strain ORS 278) TaxID=114615 RepID=UPI00015076A2|nr:DEAD/DEAH box helicase family protein [Bradyrhizobium sp. ORS 278]CAL75270.1 hypothetical protein; putative Type III restriction enzyme [Bradyrhizobium sp. ORS 278]
MKVELKTFQTDAALSVIEEIDEARVAVGKGKLQAVVLSAPTGSGKTITVAAVIEWILSGADGVVARPNTVFLWLSDSPELNNQSAAKLIGACENVTFNKVIIVESETFDEERLRAGYVYFINTQLLGKDKLLTKGGDKKNFTFWQTVANTVSASPMDFILVIDEAHRGASVAERTRKPIMQKFITGSEEDGLPPVPLVLGMSATPQRFTDLLGNTARTQRPVGITAEIARASGLLKDLIVVTCPKTGAQSDLTLLEQAASRWKQFRDKWSEYCAREKEAEIVRPVLVVQVEDGTETVLSRTPLHEVVKVVERQIGSLGPNEIVHCFQERQDITYGGRIIRRIDASRIQDAAEVKVVLFKTALTTGWDCPRAEVMMSFRRAQDPTSIAQLVGRMIRAPLARRVESDELLNTVDLYLPHYDSDALERVLAKLRSPDEQEGMPSEVTTKAVEYSRNADLATVFASLSKLPTYSVSRVPKMSDVKRALRLAGMLAHVGIDVDADDEIRERLTSKLKDLRDNCALDDPAWTQIVSDGSGIDVDVTAVALGTMSVASRQTDRIALSPENIDHLFEEAGRRLAPSEGLHRTYWKRFHDRENPGLAKVELFALIRRAGTLAQVEDVARSCFDSWWLKNKSKIAVLPASEKARFQLLVQASGKAVRQELELPLTIVEKPGARTWKNHLFVDLAGNFAANMNSWEEDCLEWAAQSPDFVCWLRNLPRREWALCVPYESGGEKPFYPDFLIVRKSGTSFVVDVMEPHDDSRTDTWAKVKGLASFADEHHLAFGRLMIGRKKNGALQFIDVSEAKTRAKARKLAASADLESLFEDA